MIASRVCRGPVLWMAAALLMAGTCRAAEVACEPGIVYATYPEEFTVSVMAAELDSLRGYEIEIEFATDLMDFVHAEPGELLHDFTPPYGLYWSVLDQGHVVRIECLIIPEDECVAGPGEILRLTFAALDARGESPLHFALATLRDCDGAPILPVNTRDGLAVIGPEAELFIDPDPKYVFGPEAFEVSLEVGPVDSLRGFQIYLRYDSTKIDFDSALVGDLMLPDPPYPLWWYVREESPSLVRIEGVILGPGLFVDGPGELIKLHYTALIDSGSTEIEFDQWHVWDVNTDEFYPVAVDDGLVIIDYHLQGVPDGGDGDATWGARRGDAARAGGLRLWPAASNPGNGARVLCEGRSPELLRAVVYEVSGRMVQHIVPCDLGGGRCSVVWDGCDARGRRAAPGVYLLRITAAGVGVTQRVALAR